MALQVAGAGKAEEWVHTTKFISRIEIKHVLNFDPF